MTSEDLEGSGNGLERTKMSTDTWHTLEPSDRTPFRRENSYYLRKLEVEVTSVSPQEQEGEGNVPSRGQQGEDSAHDSQEGV